MSNPTSVELNEFRWNDPGPEPLDTWEPAPIMINNEPFTVDIEPIYRPWFLPDYNSAESLPYHRVKSSWGYAGGKKCEGDCSAELSKDMQELKILILVGFNVTYKLHFHKEWSKCLIPTEVTIKPKRATFSSGSMRCGDEDVFVVYIEAERTSDKLKDLIERKYEAQHLDVEELHRRQTQPIIEFCNKTESLDPKCTPKKIDDDSSDIISRIDSLGTDVLASLKPIGEDVRDIRGRRDAGRKTGTKSGKLKKAYNAATIKAEMEEVRKLPINSGLSNWKLCEIVSDNLKKRYPKQGSFSQSTVYRACFKNK